VLPVCRFISIRRTGRPLLRIGAPCPLGVPETTARKPPRAGHQPVAANGKMATQNRNVFVRGSLLAMREWAPWGRRARAVHDSLRTARDSQTCGGVRRAGTAAA
jgi:hypothetical protein